MNVRDSHGAVKRQRTPSFPHGIPRPTRGDMLETLTSILDAWDSAEDATDLMKRMRPHVKRARRFIDATDQQRLVDGDL